MELNIHKWYKDSNFVSICTKSHQHICNIFVKDLLQNFPTFVTGDETIIVTDLFKLLDNANEIFDTVETRLYQNVKQKLVQNKTRLDYNLEILKKLESYFIKNSDIRFFQGLWHMEIIEAKDGKIVDKFSQESKKTFDNLQNF